MSRTIDLLKEMHGEWISQPEFTAFVIPGASVQATLRGLRINFDVLGNDDAFVGVGRLYPHPQTRSARFLRPATRQESHSYLAQFKREIAVLFRNKHDNWIGVSNRQVSPVFCVSEFVQEFESAIIYKIGDVWVFGEPFREYPGVSSGLRVSFQNRDHVILVRGSTPDHRVAYMEKIDQVVSKIQIPDSVSFMGGVLVDMVDRGDGTSLVTYLVHSTRFTSLVDNKTMRVVSAGICLDGEDSNFDLTTLIPVIRKGIETNRIHRTGIDNGYSDDD